MLRDLAQARSQGTRGLALTELASGLELDPLQLEPQLETLQTLDWVGRLEEEGDARLVLLVDPDRTGAAPLLDALLVGRRASTEPLWRVAALDKLSLAQLLGAV
jgi:membrane protein